MVSCAEQLGQMLPSIFDAEMIRHAIVKRASLMSFSIATNALSGRVRHESAALGRSEEMSRARQEQLAGPNGQHHTLCQSQRHTAS